MLAIHQFYLEVGAGVLVGALLLAFFLWFGFSTTVGDEDEMEEAKALAADRSGALAWASAVPRPANGRMRAWLDVAPEDGRPESMLWTASLVLLRHLETSHPDGYWCGKRVLELGAGMGHIAVGLARLGAHVTATEAGYSGVGVLRAWSTHLLREREGGGETVFGSDGALSAGRDARGGTLRTHELWWGERDGLSATFAENYDAVILSELVYDEELHAELVATLGRALRPGAVAHSVFCDRPCSFNFFVQLAEAGAVPPFVVSEVEPSERLELDTEAESLHLHVITRPVSN
jgi:SAM-dependent methyltransferase